MSPNVGHIFVYRSDQATVCAWAKIIKNGAKIVDDSPANDVYPLVTRDAHETVD